MSKKYHIKRREFLSRSAESFASIIAVAEDSRDEHVKDPECDGYHELNLQISDGRDSIWLGFDVSSLEEREDSLHKLKVLTDVISEFKRAVECEIEVLNAKQFVPQHARISNAIH
jgi:hypothetical protein